jgi:hypothetical protein
MKTIKMFSPLGPKEVGWDGETYKTGDDNIVEVPEAAVKELVHHGLETLGMKEAREKREAAERAELAKKHLSKAVDASAPAVAELQKVVEALQGEFGLLKEKVELLLSVPPPAADDDDDKGKGKKGKR